MSEKKRKSPIGNNYPKRDDLIPVSIKKHADKNGGHHHIILENVGDNHVSVGLTTHPKKGKNSPNAKCDFDPLGNGAKSYMRRQGIVSPVKEYGKQVYKGKMSPNDYARAKKYGDKAKEKHLNLNKKK